jgi:pimeloyl-ACP methyl ester carboxylesterase
VHHPAFDGRGFLAWDAPGCGESDCGDLSKVSIPFLVVTAEAMLQAHGIDRFHLVGHSMGGLTALMLAHAHPGQVMSFVDIEGNVAPEDCFLSRQIVDYPSDSAECSCERARAPPRTTALCDYELRLRLGTCPTPYRDHRRKPVNAVVDLPKGRRQKKQLGQLQPTNSSKTFPSLSHE